MGKFIHVFDETTDNKVLSFFHSFNNALFKDLCEFDKTLQNKELSFFHSSIQALRKRNLLYNLCISTIYWLLILAKVQGGERDSRVRFDRDFMA